MVHLNLSIYYYNKIKNICQIVQHLESNIVDERFNILSFESVTYFFILKIPFQTDTKTTIKKNVDTKIGRVISQIIIYLEEAVGLIEHLPISDKC